ncbi:MAG: hypothetical protein NTZ98_23785 [Acidobacteria bacterium]|jgi:hypothetical protein|nr:hypothetical protein [Acidobacteriota bacterium]
MKRFVLAVVTVLAFCSLAAFAGGTAFWQMDTFAEFARGKLTGISLSREGRLSLAPRLREVFSSDQALVWTVAGDSAGNVYLGTGHSGKVYKLDAQMKAREFFDAAEPDVFALAVDGQNNVYAGTSPDGKVYKIAPDGKPSEFFNPQAKYIWALAVAPDGTLYVGTGDRGRIYRVSPAGQGSLLFDTRQMHVMSLALGTDGALIAGSAPNGLLYRISPQGKAFVLYDAPLAEIHSVAIAPDGAILVSAMAAGAPKPALGMGTGVNVIAGGPAAPMTITIQASEDSPKDKEDKQKFDKDKNKEAREAAEKAAAAAAALTPPLPAVDFTAGTRSAIYRVAADHTVETLWSSRDESAYDVLPSPGGALFSTDERGRIYSVDDRKQVTLLVSTNEEETTRLLRRGSYVLAATANLGKLFQLDTAPGTSGWYESPVKDTRSISRWGKLHWRAQMEAGAEIQFFVRSGNSPNPDPTWSEWAQTTPVKSAGGRPDLFDEQIDSPPARYVQWKANFKSSGGRSATLEEVSVAYLPQNRAPIIQSVSVAPAAAVGRSRSADSAASTPGIGGTEPMVVVVDDTGGSKNVTGPAGTVSGEPPRSGAAQPTITISWQAEDPDGDPLTFDVYIRGEGESRWRLLKDDVRQSRYQPDPETLPDGKYQVRVVASDAEANPPGSARTAEQLSAPFLIDNTPPVVRVLKQERTAAAAEVRFEVADAASVLRRAEYSLDAGPWRPVYSEDGIVDSRLETFLIRLDQLQPGEHVIVLRSYDMGNNAGMGKAVLK